MNLQAVAKLQREFYQQPTLHVARELLGMHLVRRHSQGRTVGIIVETEAYVGPEDRASHASRGKTLRTAIMFGPAGYAYVYLVYGFYHCLNIVTESVDYPAAVLIRAVEPVEGLEVMKKRRGLDDPQNLTSGPGKLCQAFAIDLSVNGVDLCGNTVYVERRDNENVPVVTRPRIGVDYAGSWKRKPWRFLVRGSPYISRP